MPVMAGTITITSPSSGTDVMTGTAVGITGTATPGEFTKPNGTFQAELPPSNVTVRVDGGPPQLAAKSSVDWANWEKTVQLAPGAHTIVATATRTGAWSAQASITVNAFVPRLHVRGVEQTQGIQFFQFNGQGSGLGADNSVPLVAQKATVLRVYVDATSPAGQPTPVSVSGMVTLDSSVTIPPSNGPIAAKPQAALNRGQANDTLNFALPASLCTGTRQCTVRVFDPQRPGPRLIESELSVSLAFRSVPRLRVHGVGVHLTGPGSLNLPAPTEVSLDNTLGTLRRVGPLSGISYSGYTVIDFAGDLTTFPGPGASGCGAGWGALIDLLRALRDGSGTGDIYVGVLDSGVPVGFFGCGATGLAAARESDAFTLAHEVGHALNRLHAPCPAVAQGVDPAYPPFVPGGGIGEFGVNLATWGIPNPATTFDLMSGGCAPRWISPYTYTAMMAAIVPGLGATPAGTPLGDVGTTSADYLYLNFRAHRDGRVEVHPSFHLRGPYPAPEGGTAAPVGCDLLGPDAEVISSRRCRLDWNQSPDDPYVDYHTTLLWKPTAESIAFWSDGEVIHTHRLEQQAPAISIETPEAPEREPRAGEPHQVRVAWSVTDPAPRARYMLRYSNNDGATWRAVAAGLTEPHHIVDLDLLPGGERCRFEATASAGIRTAASVTAPFAVPVKPVQAHIHAPAQNLSIAEGEPLELRGLGYSPDFGTTDFEDLVWTSDRDGTIGLGDDTFTANLTPGRHQLRLTVPDGLGGQTIATTTVLVRPQDQEPQTPQS